MAGSGEGRKKNGSVENNAGKKTEKKARQRKLCRKSCCLLFQRLAVFFHSNSTFHQKNVEKKHPRIPNTVSLFLGGTVFGFYHSS